MTLWHPKTQEFWHEKILRRTAVSAAATATSRSSPTSDPRGRTWEPA